MVTNTINNSKDMKKMLMIMSTINDSKDMKKKGW